ncbi:branched-chain amino acid ABC transporter substrate-binding protein [Pseudorhodoplanes sinuspersici]|uniref:Branched-chain amino acid ABC transporter substrate-binding protein n=2 Tax=Pseudorhodoplanes sinuspersici TaxID=1235591 RepID=A0A1W6ZMW6_9HYPH|nr:branched-chain amino acid ABC transporter substrate-binding protein [Pseudorhodoplanes sinuspersici]
MAAAIVATAAFALGSPAQAQSGEPIKIGFGMALTGPLAANGKQALLGMQIWEDQINKKGGLLGRPVKLVYYDDQTNPSTVPGLYTKLLDVDKVDLVVGPYATNMIAPSMPVIMQKGKVYISLFGLAVNSEFNYPKYFSMIPTGQNTKPSFTEGFFDVAAKNKLGTVALVAADAEFSRNACEGARENAKKFNMKIVYDRTYPPATTDFTPIVRAIQAANPDAVVVCSYPLDSVGMVRAVNEIGFKPKMIGGAMVGLQATVFKTQLGPLLNGIINYETWVPSKHFLNPEVEAFLKEYQSRAKAAGVDPLGYYLGTWGYAYVELLGKAVEGAKSLNDDKIAKYLRTHTIPTIMGPIKFGKNGEWAESGMMQVQYKGIKGNDIDQFRGMDVQTVVAPAKLATGEAVVPFEKLR